VSLIVYYVVFMVVGDFTAYFLGLFTEYEWGSQVSLIVFLALYFLFLWVSWVLAVWVNQAQIGRAAGILSKHGEIAVSDIAETRPGIPLNRARRPPGRASLFRSVDGRGYLSAQQQSQ
jgi:hypothetical protein